MVPFGKCFMWIWGEKKVGSRVGGNSVIGQLGPVCYSNLLYLYKLFFFGGGLLILSYTERNILNGPTNFVNFLFFLSLLIFAL